MVTDNVDFPKAFREELKALKKEVRDDDSTDQAARRAHLSGLAFSGGGIRSATFNLGVLQGLAHLKLLNKFDYLSTVSGGGYIGSWLSAWIRHEYQALDESQDSGQRDAIPKPAEAGNRLPDDENVQTLTPGAKGSTASQIKKFLSRLSEFSHHPFGRSAVPVGEKEPPDPVRGEQIADEALEKVRQALDPCRDGMREKEGEAGPISHLRKYSNYLTPHRGWWSNDTWTLAVAYIRNFALTFSVLLGVLFSLVFFVHGAEVFYSMLLTPSGTIGWTLFALFAAATFCAAFAISWNLTACCAPPHSRDAEVQRPMKMTHLAIGACLLAIWCAAGGLWHIHDDFFDNFFSATTIIAVGVTLAVVFTGSYLGGMKARADCKVDGSRPADRAAKPKNKSLPLQLLVVSSICAGLILAIGLLEYWMGKWPSAPIWLGTGHWLAVVWAPLLTVIALNILVTVFVGATGKDLEEMEREWLARLLAPVTKWTGLFCLLSALVLYSPIAVQWLGFRLHGLPDGILGLLWAGISTAGAFLARGRDRNGDGRSEKWIVRMVMAIAPAVFSLGLIVIASWGLNKWWPDFLNTSDAQSVYWQVLPEVTVKALGVCLLSGITLFLFTWLWSALVGVNTFSLHALYGNRLVRAYLGASNLKRRAHPYIGFDPGDNEIRLSDLDPSRKGYPGPFLIVNAAINLVHGARLAWQQRKAASFTFTPLRCGYEFPAESASGNGREEAACGGYVCSERYAGDSGISLGKAMTISGAAACPNMGYHSSSALSILMTVFNARLGWWLPNPGLAKPGLWPNKGPGHGLFYLFCEFFGLTDAEGDYVYVSDGGHFENLGIYELVRRRVRFMVASDAAADANREFGDLGNAIERCRADFGISIDIDVNHLVPDPGTRIGRWHCAVGKIRYSQIDPRAQDGILVYIKAALTGDEPRDVAAYAARKPEFPHESTADQWFDESQFESYRALGFHTILSVMETAVRVADEKREELSPFPRSGDKDAKRDPDELARVFRELRKTWYSGKELRTGPKVDHDTLLAGILDRLRNDRLLAFLDWQLYPDLGGTVRGTALKPGAQPWVPRSYAELRAGFYFCKQLLQFMQQVYHGRDLGTAHDAPDNRGWMNLMRRWSFSRMLRYTFSMTVGTYSARFQTFCEHHLGLEVGELSWGESPLLVEDGLPLLPGDEEEQDRWKTAGSLFGFDFYETLIIREFLQLYAKTESFGDRPPCFKIYPLKTATEDPIATHADAHARITVGFAILGPVKKGLSRDCLLYLRIHPTMRGMDLFRQALEKRPKDETSGSPYPIVTILNDLDLKVLDRKTNRSWRQRIYRELYVLKRDSSRFAWLKEQYAETVADETADDELSEAVLPGI